MRVCIAEISEPISTDLTLDATLFQGRSDVLLNIYLSLFVLPFGSNGSYTFVAAPCAAMFAAWSSGFSLIMKVPSVYRTVLGLATMTVRSSMVSLPQESTAVYCRVYVPSVFIFISAPFSRLFASKSEQCNCSVLHFRCPYKQSLSAYLHLFSKSSHRLTCRL